MDSRWQNLYKLGGVAALVAAFGCRRNMSAELMITRGFGGLFDVPQVAPVRAAEWFTLLQRDGFVGLALLRVLDLVEYALVGLLFLALYAALRQAKRGVILLAVTCGLSGITVAFASNQAIAMLALSRQYAAATTEAQRAMFLAAGESLLAINGGAGGYIGLFLVLLAGLIMSVVMLRSNVFSKVAAVTGILANGFMLAYYVVLPLAPGLIVLPFVISAPFRVVWYFLIARKLFQLGKETR
jgi:hypothetical protein